MELDFLKNFTKRMKSIGSYALLFKNSINKGTWKQYGFETIYDQTNIIFSVLLYIMEQSLKDDNCTIDDIGNFIDIINMQWLKKPLSYDECKELGDFIVNSILCDEGRAMYFKGFDYDMGEYKEIHISFIANKVVYIDEDVKRTSYYLTDDGYNLMLSTLELEGNMKLTIHEMIFKLHMEKASYDKAVEDIKNIFNLLRIQLQRMKEAMRKIRQNALQFSVAEYSSILEDNLSTIEDTKNKFIGYREHVHNIISGMEDKDIRIEKLEIKEVNNLKSLKIIEGYLGRSLDEHQRILSTHFDLKDMYTKELEALSQMSLIKRFSLRNDLYEKILKQPESLAEMDLFLRPLFHREIDKTYYIGKALEYQKPFKTKEAEEAEVMVDFDNEVFQREQQAKLLQRNKLYKDSLYCILSYAFEYKEISLSQLKDLISEEEEQQLLPNVETFREIMVELLRNGSFSIDALQKEKEEHFSENVKGFQINLCLLEVIGDNENLRGMKELTVTRGEDGQVVEFINVAASHRKQEDIEEHKGKGQKRIRCSNVIIKAK